MWDLIAELREQSGMTVLLTTHYMDEADGLCDRVALMHRGHAPRPRLARRAEAPRSAPARRSTTSSAATPADLSDDEARGLRDVRSTRRTAIRLG